jgi:hypothetical protein
MLHRRARLLALILCLVLASIAVLRAQGTMPAPAFGPYTVGDDYFLGTYTQLVDYWTRLAQRSDRLELVEIGKTGEGRSMVMAIITSPENHQKLDRYKEISRRLAQAEGLTDEEARKLAAEGRAVVWIDGGLHGTEVTGAQQLFLMAYEMASRNDAETLRFLRDDILLLVPVNPDGMELVSNWYMRQADPKKRTFDDLPKLYNRYVGHDNNRDFYINNQPETKAISRQHYIEWIPQVVYNQHQTGPVGVMLFAPPFRDPFNYNMDPLVLMGIDLFGSAMHTRFLLENKAGSTMRNGATYSTWYNGGLRTTTGFHNQIGLLTEMKGTPAPMEIPLVPERQLASGELPMPIAPQVWHFRQSLEYSISANRSVLDTASKHREDLLFDIYRMGKNSMERGSRDSWTVTPRRVDAMVAAWQKDNPGATRVAGSRGPTPIPSRYFDLLRQPAQRDPRGFIIPSDQSDFSTATKFVNALIESGIAVHRATGAFQAAGKSYPAGSYVVKTTQAFRPHVLDMFEPQDHPNDIPYPGGPPKPPYDATGYTLALQMGVQFDRVLDAFDGPFEKLPGVVKLPPGTVAEARTVAGYLLSHQVNDAFTATTRLLASKEDVYWLQQPFTSGGNTFPAGTIYVPAKPTTRATVQKIAADTGVHLETVATRPAGDALKLRPMRVALWDQYGGSMPSGWIRWLFEQQFPIAVDLVYPPALDEGNLAAKYDVIIFPDGAIPDPEARSGGRSERAGVDRESLPPEWKDKVGSVTAAKTVPQLRRFVEEGGTIVAIGDSTNLAYDLGLAIRNHLVERLPNGTERRLGPEQFYIPGSLLECSVDNTNPLAYGMPGKLDVFFDNSPVFRLEPDAARRGARAVAWFAGPEPLQSGWAWGQGYLQGGAAVVEARLGKGNVFLFGPLVTFRGQPHASFKFLFNAIYYGGATPVRLAGPKGTNQD